MTAGPEARERLIEEARKRAGELGLAGCDPERLSRDLRLNREAACADFPTCESVATSVVQADLFSQREEMAEAIASDQPHALRLGTALRSWIMTAWDDSQRASQRLLSEALGVTAAEPALLKHRDWVIATLESILDAGLASGEFDLRDPRRMAALIHLMGSALVPPKSTACPEDLPLILHDLVDLLQRALEPPMMIAD